MISSFAFDELITLHIIYSFEKFSSKARPSPIHPITSDIEFEWEEITRFRLPTKIYILNEQL